MYKNKSLLEYQWEVYDRKGDIGLSTIYQNNAYQDVKAQNRSSNHRLPYHREGNNKDKSWQIEDRLQQSEKNLYTLQNEIVRRRNNDAKDHIFINKKPYKRLKYQFNNKTALQNQLFMQRNSSQSKRPIKIGSYQFGEIDKKNLNQNFSKGKVNEFQSKPLKKSIKQKLHQFISTRRNQVECTMNQQSGKYRYGSRNPQKIQQYHSLTPLQLYSSINECQSPSKQRQQIKANYWDYTVVSLDTVQSKKYMREQISSKLNKFVRRQKIINKEAQEKRRQCLYKSNLLKTHSKLQPLASSQKKQLDFGQQTKLKQIIRKYFSSKDKYNSDQKLLKIQQITK